MDEQGVGLADAAPVLGVELNPDEPRVRQLRRPVTVRLRQLDDFDEVTVRVHAREHEACLAEPVAEVVVDLVAVAVALLDGGRPGVDLLRQRALAEGARVGAQAHGAALVGDRLLLGHHRDDRRRVVGVELGRVRLGQPGDVARELDRGDLHPEADAEERDARLARPADRLDLAVDAAVAEARRHQHARDARQLVRHVGRRHVVREDAADFDLDAVLGRGQQQALRDRLVGVLVLDVLADERDRDLPLGVLETAQEVDPVLQVGRRVHVQRRVEAEALEDHLVQLLLAQQQRDLVDRLGVERLDHRLGADVAEQADLAAHVLRQRVLGARHQHVRLEAVALERLDGVLGRLRLELAGRREEGHQRQVDERGVLLALLQRQLADGLQVGQALDVARGAAHLSDDDVVVAGLGEAPHPALDLVDHVGHHLDGLAEVGARALLRDHARVHAARGHVVGLRHGHAEVALVVAQVEVGLGAVVGDVHLAVLERVHGPRVDVDVGVELLDRDPQPAGFQQPPEAGGDDSLAQRRRHAAGHEKELTRGSGGVCGHRRGVWTLAQKATGPRARQREPDEVSRAARPASVGARDCGFCNTRRDGPLTRGSWLRLASPPPHLSR